MTGSPILIRHGMISFLLLRLIMIPVKVIWLLRSSILLEIGVLITISIVLVLTKMLLWLVMLTEMVLLMMLFLVYLVILPLTATIFVLNSLVLAWRKPFLLLKLVKISFLKALVHQTVFPSIIFIEIPTLNKSLHPMRLAKACRVLFHPSLLTMPIVLLLL